MSKKIVKPLLFILLICFVIFLFKNTESIRYYSPQQIKNFINSFGSLAPIIYIILFTFVPLTFFPDSILAISGGLAFGLFYGTLYTVIGAVLGSTLAFFIASYFGKPVVDKLLKDKVKMDFFSKGNREFFTVLVLRLIPLVPFDVISYGAGLSKIKYKNFISATIIGILPGVIVFSNLGDKSLDFTSPHFIIAIILLIALFSLSIILKNTLLKNKYN